MTRTGTAVAPSPANMKKTLRIAPLLVAFSFVAAACTPVETLEPLEDGEERTGEAEGMIDEACEDDLYMRSGASDLCLAPVSNSMLQSSWVGQYECLCPASNKLEWLPIPIPARNSPFMVAIQSAHGNANGQHMCIDRPNGSTTTHTQLQSYPCHYGPAQTWLIRALSYKGARYWQYEAAHFDAAGGVVRSGKCIDVPGNSANVGAIFQLYPCKTTSDPEPRNQLFHALW